MREIKFRAWDKRQFEDGRMFEVKGMEWPKDCDPIVWGSGKKTPNVVLLQYTELKDKNDREIYEGDIVHITPTPGARTKDWEQWSTNEHKAITFDGCAFRFDGMNLAEIFGWGGYPSHINPEVVGNIYENPELLSK
jgi:uncharacterized phage protein (TIGR01671 family)